MSLKPDSSEVCGPPTTRVPRLVSLDVPSGMRSAIDLRETLAKTLARGKSAVRVNVGTIGFPDVAVLQVLCAGHRRALERGIRMEVAGDGVGSVVYLAELCGLSGPVSCGLAHDVTCPWASDIHMTD